MSTFFQLAKGGIKSNTMQFNGGFLAILAALSQTQFFTTNPRAIAFLAVANAIANLILRLKTKTAIADR